MAHKQEQSKRDTPECDKLRVRAGHSIPLAVYPPRPLLLDKPLESKVDGLTGELARKHEGDLYLAGEEDQCSVDDAEGLREEGEVRAYEGEFIMRVLIRGKLGEVLEIEVLAYIVDVGDGERGKGRRVLHDGN